MGNGTRGTITPMTPGKHPLQDRGRVLGKPVLEGCRRARRAVVVLNCLCLLVMSTEDLPCAKRKLTAGFVCVCNSTYCDTIGRPRKLPRSNYHLYTTSSSRPGFSKTTGKFNGKATDSDENDVVFKINNGVKYQEILGFGGAFTDSAGMVSSALPEKAYEKFIESYFGFQGIEYTLCRVPIGGSDFCVRDYTLDDVPHDEHLHHFKLAEEDIKFKIPMISKAMVASSRRLSVYATTWGSPEWMKIKIKPNNTWGYINPKYYGTWALYFVKFLEAYKAKGVDIFAISGGNEPFASITLGVPMNETCWLPEPHRLWVKNHLIPQLKSANFSHVKFLTLDDQRNFVLEWMSAFAADPEAYKMVDGIATHWYYDYYTSPTILDELHRKYPDKLSLKTESSISQLNRKPGEPPVYLGSWGRAELYIHNIIENLNHWTNGYIDWNLALNTSGGPTIVEPLDAAVIVNTTSGEFYKQPIFYAMGHFSKFIRPGSRKVHVESNQKQPIESECRKNITFNIHAFQKWFAASFTGHGYPPQTIPSVIHCLATANPDRSNTIVLFNPLKKATPVKIIVDGANSASLILKPNSINTMVYWK